MLSFCEFLFCKWFSYFPAVWSHSPEFPAYFTEEKIFILFVLKINHKNCDTYLTSSLNSQNKNATNIVNEKETESGGVKEKIEKMLKKGLQNDIFKLSDALKFWHLVFTKLHFQSPLLCRSRGSPSESASALGWVSVAWCLWTSQRKKSKTSFSFLLRFFSISSANWRTLKRFASGGAGDGGLESANR